VLLACGIEASAGVVGVTPIAASGQTVPQGTLTTLNSPFTNALGQVGFTGSIETPAGTTSFVWIDNGIAWLSSDALPIVITGAETTMGIGNAGEFIYSPSVDGLDAVWGEEGLILRETDAAPGLPSLFVTFCSRPRMLPDGRSYWLSGTTTSQGGVTNGRALFSRAPDGLITPVVASGQAIDGLILSDVGVDFEYDVSDNNAYRITLHDTTADAALDALVAINGSLAVQEGAPTGDGDNWQNFDTVGINNFGDWLLAGDTNGPLSNEEFIAFNGSIVIREADTLAGVPLGGGSVTALSLNNIGDAVFIWNLDAAEVLFFAETSAFPSAVVVLQVGDSIDTNGDDIADATVTDLNASGVVGPGLDLPDTGQLYLGIDAMTASGETEMIVAVDLPGDPPPLCPADLFPRVGDGIVGAGDLGQLLAQWGPCPDPGDCPADIFPPGTGDGIVGPGDLGDLLAQWGACR
jgi:hypothetical protein